MQQFRLTQAIQAYQDGYLDLHQAAEQANLSVAVLLEEMAARKVAVLETSDTFGAGLTALRETFGQEAMVESDTP